MSVKAFVGATLIDGTGRDPVPNATVVVEDNKIADVKAGSPGALPTGAEVVDCGGKFLLPGLIDAHVHLGSVMSNYGDMMRGIYPSEHVVMALEVMEDTLMQGFTSCRDIGHICIGFRKLQREGKIKAPRIVTCGRFMSQTGGHCERRLATETTPPYQAILHCGYIVDGVVEVRKACRDILRQGADFIKIMAAGGCGSPTDSLDAIQFSPEEIQAAVWEAQAQGTYVAAHCYSVRSIRHCLENGVYTIEHGNYIDKPTAQFLKDKNAVLVPTITTYQVIAEKGPELGFPDYFVRKIRMVVDAALEGLANAWAVGCTIASGSDVVGAAQPYKNYEIEQKAKVMGPMQAIVATTLTNAKLLKMDDIVGTVEPGKYADLVMMDSDPLENPAIFKDRDRMVMIMQDGKYFKKTF
ncbi:MAG: amidohydrolase family protein [Candidatus Accumulibacter sp.]|jgi:imidazolonepropionase-like amidohydrolase|nr:amidohydrolase family protein [Accumulibacter sp.]